VYGLFARILDGPAVINDPSQFSDVYTRVTNVSAYIKATPGVIKHLQNKVKVIASEYIIDPMLYLGYKFHVRIMCIAFIGEDNELSVWVKNTGMVVPAAAVYSAGNFDSAEIHDTHLTSNTPLAGIYPDVLTAANTDVGTLTAANTDGYALSGIGNIAVRPSAVNDLIKKLFTVMRPWINKYPEAENAYDLYGIDIMFKADGSARLIEVNNLPGYPGGLLGSRTSFDSAAFDRDIFSSIMATAFSEVFEKKGDSSLVTRVL
jgi:Tubulin-tyrosine ligase family